MDNVINFPIKKEVADPAYEFLLMHLIPWATAHGIDTSSKQFGLTWAAIFFLLQGLNV